MRKLTQFFGLGLALLLCASATSALELDAMSANERGVALASKNKVSQSIQYFEHATNEDPSNAEYINNLGVSHMRLGHLEEAERLFKKALLVDSAFDMATKNLADLQAYMSSTSAASTKTKARASSKKAKNEKAAKSKSKNKKKRLAEEEEFELGEDGKPVAVESADGKTVKIGHKLFHRLPRIPYSKLYDPENAQYADGRAPFLLTGAMDNWPANGKWGKDYLIKTFPDSIVDFYPHNMDKVDTHPFLTKMSVALTEMFDPTGAFPNNPVHPGTYIQWNINLNDWRKLSSQFYLPYAFQRDEELLQCLENDDLIDEYSRRVHWRMMLFATKGAGMFIHIDVLRTASWQGQVAGAKKWIICGPENKPYMYRAGQIDGWNWNKKQYPLFEHAFCYEDTVRAGEMVFYPKDYWHQTENLMTPSISASSTVIDQNNFEEIITELNNECDFQKFRWGFSKELCTALKTQCFPRWRERFADKERPTCSVQQS